MTTSSLSAGREPGMFPRGQMAAAVEASGAVPVSDPSLAGPADRSALMRAAGACWLASAACITVMAARGASVAWIIAWFTATAAIAEITTLTEQAPAAHEAFREASTAPPSPQNPLPFPQTMSPPNTGCGEPTTRPRQKT